MTALFDGATRPLHVPFTLTEPQARILRAVCQHGERHYDGRSRRSIQRLVNLGLVTAHMNLVPRSKGYGLDAVEQWEVRPNWVSAFCSWCSGRVSAGNRCARIAANGRMYQFDSESCRTAFDEDSTRDDS